MNRRPGRAPRRGQDEPEIYRIAERNGGVCTIGSCTTKPGIVTSVVEECRITLDQRHLDPAAARADAPGGPRGGRAVRRGGQCRGVLGQDLEDRARPVQRRPDRAMRGVDPGNLRHGAPGCRPGPLHDAAEVPGRASRPS